MSVPKIIHQTWKTLSLDPKFKKWSESWKLMNPDYEYRFYNDSDCYKFIYHKYPEFLDLYNDLLPIQKSDVFRYLILHHHGGIYADMDTACFRPLDNLINDNCLITGIEYESTENKGVQYLQWFIASPKGHPVLLELVKEIENRLWYRWFISFIKTPNELTYWLTGPELFTDVLIKHRKDIKIMPKGILGSYDSKRLSPSSYLQHYFVGSWKAIPPPGPL